MNHFFLKIRTLSNYTTYNLSNVLGNLLIAKKYNVNINLTYWKDLLGLKKIFS